MAEPTGTDIGSDARPNTPDALEALKARHPDVDLGLSETEAGVVIDRMRGDPAALDAVWTDLTDWADRNQQALGATPKRGALEREKLLQRKFGKNSDREGFPPSARVREPQELEQTVSPEVEASPPPALEAIRDPLAEFAEYLPGRYVAQINREAMVSGLSAGEMNNSELTARLEQAKNELHSSRTLGPALEKWAGDYREDAAWQEAFARRSGSRWTPLDGRQAYLPGKEVDSIRKRASILQEKLDRMKGKVRDAYEKRAQERDAFGALDRVYENWTNEKKELAAETVALGRLQNLRQEIAAIERAGPEAQSQDPTTSSRTMAGLDAFAVENGRRFGEDRVNRIVNQAVAIQEEFKGADPAVIQAVRDRHMERITPADGNGAYETQRLEGRWHALVEKRKSIAAAGAQARDATSREEHARDWKRAGKELADVRAAGRRQWDQGTHLDTSMNKCSFDMAVTVAANQELLERGHEVAKRPGLDANLPQQARAADAELVAGVTSGGADDGFGK